MNSRERMDRAMHLGEADRVPVMCQLSLGHYFLQSGLDAIDIWHSTEAFAEALIRLQRRYGFDGILVNLPGRNPEWRRWLRRIDKRENKRFITWADGSTTVAPPDDNPHVRRPDGTRFAIRYEDVDPERLFYVEPHHMFGPKYPASWEPGAEPSPPGPEFFPPWQYDTLKLVLERTAGEVSVHGEVFSPFSQFLELLGYADGLMALMDDPGKAGACLEALCRGTVELARGQIRAGVHAILISSAFAGAGFISRKHYSRFVLPYESKVVQGIRETSDLPVYTHTCGAIGDRLDLMLETGTSGIDTLDPPPIGTVELEEARRQTRGRVFLKGNIDPVNTLLRGTPAESCLSARRCIEIAAAGGGYILSTACSVAPATPPENILQLRAAAEAFGRYPL